MSKELIIKKCLKCGAVVKVMQDCSCESCEIICCDEKMQELVANSTDGAIEKHVPNYEIDGKQIKVFVNHVMEEEHFIEWICFKSEQKEEYVFLQPGMSANAVFENVNGGTLYAYCNKHGLWEMMVKNK